MTPNKLYKLLDIVEDIKKLDRMIMIHGQNEDDTIMSSQYEAKKVKLLSHLIKELNNEPTKNSFDNLLVIRKLLDKFIINDNFSESQINLEAPDLKRLAEAF